jgi:hypothetical protein
VPIIAGPFHVIVGLLLIAGVAKLARPGPTAEVAQAAGIPFASSIVRVFAVAEIVAAVAAFAVGGRYTAAAVGGLYAVFAGFIVMLKMRGIKTAGCGCFGQESDDPPGFLHVAIDLVAAGIATIAVVAPVPDLYTVLADQPLAGVPYVAFVAIGVWLMMVMLNDLPKLMYLVAETSS